ncbi:MAG TPA: tetratricopeptide repeat protein, partial [Roseiflexaceae bacterium]
MPKKKKSHTPTQSAPGMPRQLQEGLDQADALMSRNRWVEARGILEPLNQRYPHRYDVLAGLSNVYHELHDYQRYLEVAVELVRLAPRDPDISLMLAGAYLVNVMPMLALRTFRRVIERWPDYPRADEIRKEIVQLEGHMDSLLADLGLAGEAGFEVAALHEEARSLIEQGRYAQARQVEEQLLRRHPNFVPALNNISLAYGVEGRLDQAIATAQRVLEIDPDNYHALGNLARYFYLSGRVDEARQWADRLKQGSSNGLDAWAKKAETASFLGDDQAVLDAFHGAEQAGQLQPPLGAPLMYHFAAVAAIRLGRDDEAHGYWRQALKISPGFPLAQANLDDLKKPVGERHAPWAFPIGEWMTQRAVRDLVAQIQPATRRGGDAALTQAARRYLKQHPEMVELIPVLLERGDPQGRGYAFQLAMSAKTPELLAALRDFALSQRGPDSLRNRAAQVALEAGLLPRRVTLWVGGEWREILLMSYTLHEEPTIDHASNVGKLLAEATLALQRNQAKQAETLLEEAREIEPDAPDILNNLAVAYGQQRRNKEADALLQQIVERHPDYAFTRISLARTHLLRGEIAEARALLDPMHEWER